MYRCAYQTIANIKADLPDEAKCLVWFGYGAADSSYIVPLWACATRLPELFATGTRYDAFNRNSGWWVNSYVQQTAATNYESAIKDIHEARDGKLERIGFKDFNLIAEIGECDQAFYLMIPVGAPAQHMQKQIDLGGGY